MIDPVFNFSDESVGIPEVVTRPCAELEAIVRDLAAHPLRDPRDCWEEWCISCEVPFCVGEVHEPGCYYTRAVEWVAAHPVVTDADPQ